MNLPKREDTSTLDLSLKHALKNWANRSQPPQDGKSRLFKAALQTSRQASTPKVSKFSSLISITLHDEFVQIYLEGFRKIPYYDLQPGAMMMNYPSCIMVR